MKEELVRNLVNGSYIKSGTELSAVYKSHHIFGIPAVIKDTVRVVRIINKDGKLFFSVVPRSENKTVIISPDQIYEIDGMLADRIIKAYNLTEDGKKKPRKSRKLKATSV